MRRNFTLVHLGNAVSSERERRRSRFEKMMRSSNDPAKTKLTVYIFQSRFKKQK
jgi:hypothetical protein